MREGTFDCGARVTIFYFQLQMTWAWNFLHPFRSRLSRALGIESIRNGGVGIVVVGVEYRGAEARSAFDNEKIKEGCGYLFEFLDLSLRALLSILLGAKFSFGRAMVLLQLDTENHLKVFSSLIFSGLAKAFYCHCSREYPPYTVSCFSGPFGLPFPNLVGKLWSGLC